MGNTSNITWPDKVDLFGVAVSPTRYDEAVNAIVAAAEQRAPAIVSCHAVHAVITASGDPGLRAKVNTFEMITPDGQPVRWALNLLHQAKLTDRVYGPELMLRLCRRAAREGVSIYLYGGSEKVVADLQKKLVHEFPSLCIAGAESPPFRELTDEEDMAAVDRINRSGAGLIFIGLGCPKQDVFAFEHRARIHAVQICVGAAFDFHAGAKPMAPDWMQRFALEWLFRLQQEPRRLWRRYLATNTVFVVKLTLALCRRMLGGHRKPRPLEAGPAGKLNPVEAESDLARDREHVVH